MAVVILSKAELHVHLEGSIFLETLQAIDPSVTAQEFGNRMRLQNFAEFIDSYKWVTTRLRTPEHYALATRMLLERLRAQDVSYAEITLSAGVVLWKQQDLAAVYEAVWRESQKSRVETFWILDVIRHLGTEPAWPVARFAAEHSNNGVVALGIGGDEVRGPAQWFGEMFQYARDHGMHLVAHAGETTGPESIWAALAIGAERIGHGVSAVKDPVLLDELRARNIPLEVCLTSNVCTGVVSSLEEHPVRRAYDAGVPITIHTDDPAFFNTSLSQEYEIAENLFGLPKQEMAANARRYGFR
jgi:adenosine deaminase/aminodeoxyfutalosine deaminase